MFYEDFDCILPSTKVALVEFDAERPDSRQISVPLVEFQFLASQEFNKLDADLREQSTVAGLSANCYV